MEPNIQNQETKKISAGRLILIQLFLLFLVVIQFLPHIMSDTGPSQSNINSINITRLFLGLFSLYSIIIAVREFIKEGKATSIWYIVLILISLIGVLSAVSLTFTFSILLGLLLGF